MPSSSAPPSPDASFGRWASPAAAASSGGSFKAALHRLVASALAMIERSASRRHLAEMDARMLRDVGVSPSERREELRKWFWQR